MRRLAQLLPRRFLTNSLELVVRELPLRALLPLALAIFLLFAVLGPVIDVNAGGHLPTRFVLGVAAFSGFIAVGYGFGTMRRNWTLLAASVAVQFTWLLVGHRLVPAGTRLSDAAAAAQLKYDAIA